jgi:hypothetical protein
MITLIHLFIFENSKKLIHVETLILGNKDESKLFFAIFYIEVFIILNAIEMSK